MKVVIERTVLLKSLSHVQSIVERRNTIAILSNVKLEAKDGRLSLNATDMDLDIVETVAADVAREGAATAPAHTFYDIVRKLPDGSQVELDYSAQDGHLTLRSGRSKFSLACLPVEDFPVIAGSDLPHHLTLSAEGLKTLIDQTRFAICHEETRYYLNGIYIHSTESHGQTVIRTVATDGHRLARVEIPAPADLGTMPGVILPKKMVGELRKLLDEGSTEIAISLSETKIRFAFDSAILTSKLIDGTFPDYERVIPSGNDKLLDIETKTLMAAVDRVSAISSDKSRAVKLALTANQVTLSASSPEQGSATEEIEAHYQGAPIEIGFNARYLLEVMAQIKGDMVRVTFSDGGAPAVIAETDDLSALYVLMPMRV